MGKAYTVTLIDKKSSMQNGISILHHNDSPSYIDYAGLDVILPVTGCVFQHDRSKLIAIHGDCHLIVIKYREKDTVITGDGKTGSLEELIKARNKHIADLDNYRKEAFKEGLFRANNRLATILKNSKHKSIKSPGVLPEDYADCECSTMTGDFVEPKHLIVKKVVTQDLAYTLLELPYNESIYIMHGDAGNELITKLTATKSNINKKDILQ